jgi:hypothetical protein
MPKTLFVDGLAELEKLEKQSADIKFKLFIPRAVAQFTKPLRVWSTSNGTSNMIVIGTADLVAVAKLRTGEPVPDGAVTTTYFKL